MHRIRLFAAELRGTLPALTRGSMMRRFECILVVQCFFLPALGHALSVGPGQGIEIEQVDFTFPGATLLDSDWGRLAAAPTQLFDQLGISSGFVNAFTDAGWVVQNLPVGIEDAPDTIAAYFDLGILPPQNVSLLSAYIEFEAQPRATFADGPRAGFLVGSASWNAEGAGGATVTAAGAPTPVTPQFVPGGATFKRNQPYAANVQCAMNQCFPMAIANSLEYMERRFGIVVPHDHRLGLKGDNTLVGQLDTAVDRFAPARNLGSGVWFTPMLQGKFFYLFSNGLAGKLNHEHQGRGYGTPPGEALPNGNITRSGITSVDKGPVVTWDWLCGQLQTGADVELVFAYDGGGGHVVRLVGCGRTLDAPWVDYVHDREQTHVDPLDVRGKERIRAYVRDEDGDGSLNIGTLNREVKLGLSESLVGVKTPAVAPWGIALLAVFLVAVSSLAVVTPGSRFTRRGRGPR